MRFSYQAILFDCDGVIVDTETLSSNILQRMLAEQGLHLDEHTLHTQFAGHTNQENLALAESMLGKALPANFASQFRDEFQRSIKTSLQPIPGVTELLSAIQCPIAMATNAQREELELKLELIQLSDVFHTRFAVDDVKQGKPAPDLYLKAASALGVAPQDCIVIEDSLAGIRAGVAAGATVLAYSAVFTAQAQLDAGATLTFNSMPELMTLLGLK
ncbi:HAD family hydrolase [Marinomonas fungiae]|uniref:Haloacid dehalogenase superfamily, subfamily IA, variant 3 with third motif having DD or ED n=1 Tax=Marinomonas fungiae TaxID=1137284 RepID=A0A0K6IL36_9GAMM|nr:HAD family phosphatase [Marinomonas fungiae]CUB04042.1 haloacid dehalogenase superfamily, subfamily IA, variant 3 with third motif having DD or ED [Marinomonas fungiae]